MLELVDGLQIAAVLVVDDRPDEVEQVLDDLSKHGCLVTYCESQETASNLLSGGVVFDLLVLDWHLEADNSTVAALVLSDVLDYCFVPVAVWTRYYEEASKELDEGRYDFPRDMIIPLEKENDAEVLRRKVIDWLNTKPQTRLGLLWSRSVRLSLADPIRQMHELHGGELGSLAKYVLSKGFDSPQLAAEELLELLQCLLGRKVREQPRLIQTVVRILEAEREHALEMSRERFARFRSAEMYWGRAGDTTVRTGNIIHMGGDPWEFAVVLTPACDLVGPTAKSNYVLLARAWKKKELYEARRMNSNMRRDIVGHRKGRYHLLPFVPVDDHKMDLIVDFQEVEAILLESAEGKIEEEGAWTIVATVESPYREHLIQRYLSLMGRVGIPDLPGQVEEDLRRPQ